MEFNFVPRVLSNFLIESKFNQILNHIYKSEMFDFLLTIPYCVTWLHKFMPSIHLKIPNSCAFFILPFKFQYLFIVSHKMYIFKQKIVIENKSIHKAFNEIIQYYWWYHWCGLIPRPFHYLTKKNWLTKKINCPNCWEFRGVI